MFHSRIGLPDMWECALPYLMNAWYVAAWAHEVTDALLPRTLLDIPVLLLRDEAGDVVALHDVCPHRFAPLSMGSIVDGKIRCGYHGLEFDLHGNCVGSCLNVAAPKAARVRRFPIVEQDTIVWIWMGDREPADPSTIIRFPFFANPEMRAVSGSMVAAAQYQIISDNLMDLTHAALLHPIFGGLAYQPAFKSWEDGDDVISEYRSEAESSLIAGPVANVGTDTIRWRAPGIHDLMTRIEPKDPNYPVFEMPAAHIVTPETATTTHYFWGAAISKESQLSSKDFAAGLQNAFDYEDKPMVEAVQRRMGNNDLFDLKPLLLPIDASAVRARRKLAAMIAAEQSGTPVRQAEPVDA